MKIAEILQVEMPHSSAALASMFNVLSFGHRARAESCGHPSAIGHSRTLLMHADRVDGAQLAGQLNLAGLSTDLVVSWHDAHAFLEANYFHSCVLPVAVDHPGDLNQLERLRRAAPRMWIVVLSDRHALRRTVRDPLLTT